MKKFVPKLSSQSSNPALAYCTSDVKFLRSGSFLTAMIIPIIQNGAKQ